MIQANVKVCLFKIFLRTLDKDKQLENCPSIHSCWENSKIGWRPACYDEVDLYAELFREVANYAADKLRGPRHFLSERKLCLFKNFLGDATPQKFVTEP